MKRILSIALFIILLFNTIPLIGLAKSDTQISTNIIYLENGCYVIEELVTLESRALNMITGTKNQRYYNSSGEQVWYASLTGTFSYNGSSATCTVATCDVTIINTSWYVISKSADKSGNVARCSVTMGRKMLGVKVDEESISFKLTCDPNGNLN